MIHPSYTEDIEHLDFDVPCARCNARWMTPKGNGVGELVVVGRCGESCSANGRRWMFCLDCACACGYCSLCGELGHYEAA